MDLLRRWLSDKNFYTVIQQSSSSKVLDGWIVQGAPTVKDGIYAFTIYRTTFEKRIPVQGTVVTKVGMDVDDAYKMLASERRRNDPTRIFTGFTK